MFRRTLICLCCFSLLSAPTVAATPPVSFRAVLELPVVEPDRVLPYGNAEPQFIELFVPEQDSIGFVVFVHGGCWLNAFDVGHARPLAHALRENGYAVAALEFRRLGDEGGGWPGTLNDIHTALEVLQEDTEFTLTDSVLMGHSAGGHLALLAAQESPALGVIGLAAITDIAIYASGESGCEQAAARFVSTAPEAISAMSPVQLPQQRVHLLHGEEDAIVPLTQAEFPDAEVMILPSLGHFDLIHPDTAAFAEILKRLRAIYDLQE